MFKTGPGASISVSKKSILEANNSFIDDSKLTQNVEEATDFL